MLTREQVEAMSDDQADIYIAKEVLGMKWKSWDRDKLNATEPSVDDWGKWEIDERDTGGIYKSYDVNIPDSHSWSPSWHTDDAMAIIKQIGQYHEKVEHEIPDGGWFQLISCPDGWISGWFGSDEFSEFYRSEAKIPSRAISNSIILANEGKNNLEKKT